MRRRGTPGSNKGAHFAAFEIDPATTRFMATVGKVGKAHHYSLCSKIFDPYQQRLVIYVQHRDRGVRFCWVRLPIETGTLVWMVAWRGVAAPYNPPRRPPLFRGWMALIVLVSISQHAPRHHHTKEIDYGPR